ncbi:MAG: taurine dioxygenase [Polaromonas sp.]|nr:taurine dioxygenase [Polaromonas sp.]
MSVADITSLSQQRAAPRIDTLGSTPASALYSARLCEGDPSLKVQPLSAHIGAEISGLDLRKKLNTAQIATVARALHQWKVVFFRDQHLDHSQHIAFARQFGDLTVGHPVFGHVEGYPEIWKSIRSANTAKATGKRARPKGAPGRGGIPMSRPR